VLKLGMIVMGAADMDRAERFWTEALGYRLGVAQDGGDWRELVPADGDGAVIGLQRSDATPRHDPRLHIDLHVASDDEQATEVERLVGLGAERVDWDHYPADPDFVVLADPEGNIFCVVNPAHGA
jgi:catechol 2,3-dioxygenase-like lactoylglutathione lyase family enzyme